MVVAVAVGLFRTFDWCLTDKFPIGRVVAGARDDCNTWTAAFELADGTVKTVAARIGK